MLWRWHLTSNIVEIGTYFVVVATAAIYGYVAYSAVAISRALSNNIYRRQALGMGVVSITIAVLGIGVTIFPSANSGIPFVAGFLSYYAVFIGFYYWIDASIGAARLTDPLFRNTLYWTRLRLAFWAYDAAATIIFLILGSLGTVTYATASPLLTVFVIGPLIIMIFSGVVALPIAAHRSKDKVLKRHLNWFAVYAAVVLGFFFVWGSAIPGVTNLENLIAVALGGYLLYRCVGSLVPIYTFKNKVTQKN
jgi:hypothetical protein